MMLSAGLLPMLIAQTWLPGLEELRQGFTGQASDSNIPRILLAALLLCLSALLVDQLYRARHRRRAPKRTDYLTESAWLLGLRRRELRLLRTIASRSGLRHPVAMLLSPANLAYGTHLALRAANSPRLRRAANRLAIRVFGTELPEITEPLER